MSMPNLKASLKLMTIHESSKRQTSGKLAHVISNYLKYTEIYTYIFGFNIVHLSTNSKLDFGIEQNHASRLSLCIPFVSEAFRSEDFISLRMSH